MTDNEFNQLIEDNGLAGAEAILADNIVAEPKKIRFKIQYARCAMMAKNYAEAEIRWKAILENDLENRWANQQLCKCYLLQGKLSEAERLTEQWPAKFFEFENLRNVWAECAVSKHDWREAYARFTTHQPSQRPTPKLLDSPDDRIAFEAGYVEETVSAYSVQSVVNNKVTEQKLPEGNLEPVGLYTLENALLSGRGYLISNDQLLAYPNLVQGYVRKRIDTCELGFPKCLSNPIREVDEPLIFFATEGIKVYGHWLLDMLPRLFYGLKEHPDVFQKYKIALSTRTPNWAVQFLEELYGIQRDRIIFYNSDKERLATRTAYVPSLLHTRYNFHSQMDAFCSFMIDKFNLPNSGEVNPKIYVSRKNTVPTTAARNMQNLAVVEDYMRDRGYAIVHNEGLSWQEKITHYQSAKIMVGQYGSGLHNALFSKNHSVLVSFRQQNGVQNEIARLRNQTLVHVEPRSEARVGKSVNFDIHLEDLALAIDIAEAPGRTLG